MINRNGFTLGLFALVTFSLGAATVTNVCPPDTIHDSIRVSQTCDGIQSSIIVDGVDRVFIAYGNDNPTTGPIGVGTVGIETGDGDYNDAVVQVIVDHNGAAFLGWLSALSDWSSTVSVVGRPGSVDQFRHSLSLGTFAIGSEIVLDMHVLQSGADYYSGAISRNSGYSHWIVQDPATATNTPEPASLASASIGLALIGFSVVRRRKQEAGRTKVS